MNASLIKTVVMLSYLTYFIQNVDKFDSQKCSFKRRQNAISNWKDKHLHLINGNQRIFIEF